VSDAPPGSSWGRPAAAPRDADSTRSRRFRALLHGRAFAYALVPGIVAAVVAGAAAHSLALLAAGPLVVIAIVLAVSFVTADRRAALDFFRGYAAARGFRYVGDAGVMPLTPLLAAGDVRHFTYWMRGPLDGSVRCGLGHYTYEVRERSAGGRRRARDTRRFTVCVVDHEAGMRQFPGLFLCRRRGVLDAIDHHDWLSHHNRHKVELESAALCDRYDLWVDDGQDELLLRELFVPSFEVLLAEHPLQPCFEYRAGTLVVYLERLLDDEGHLDWLREVSATIAGRFSAEIQLRVA